jgi:hypothetical protein
VSEGALHGIPVALTVAHVDRYEGRHVLVAAGPHLRCTEHFGTIEKEGVADALAALSHSRRCDRFGIAWQRSMLADDENFIPVIRALPNELLRYHADQTRRHAARLDGLLDRTTPKRERRRWHNIGWRAAPSLAARYQAEGVEAGIAFVAMRHRIDPSDVQRAASDERGPLGQALRDGGHDRLKLLNLGLRTRVTDDFPYEPLDASLATVPAEAPPPTPTAWTLDAALLQELADLSPEEVAIRIREWAEGHEPEEEPPSRM